jgi:hypothetical protein
MYVHGPCRCENCRIAESAYQRAYRVANRERLNAYDRLPERDSRLRDDRQKRLIRHRSYDQLRRGKPKPQCEECGGDGAQIHHEDYNRPDLVHFLCATCHGKAHRRQSPSLL